MAAQAAEDAAWTELQRCTAWWLGEFLNTAAGETAGHKQPETPEDEDDGEDTAGLSTAETLALKVRGQLHDWHISNLYGMSGKMYIGILHAASSWLLRSCCFVCL